MEDFKKLPKMQSFKTGGAVASEYCGGGRMKKKEGGKIDEAQDKAIVKKAFKQHDKAEHDKEEPTEIKLKKGGRAKKEVGTVKKYKAGGKISGEQGKAGHEDGYIKVKPTADKKAEAPSKGSEKPNFRASDVEKEKSKPAGHKDPYIKSKESGKSADAPSKGESKGKEVKKFADGGQTAPVAPGLLARIGRRLRNNVMGSPEQNAAAQARMEAMAQGQAAQQAQTPPAPQAPTSDGQAPTMPGIPAQKRGGKVKGKK